MLKLGTRSFVTSVVAALAICAAVSSSDAAWLFYHKPAFEGRLLDRETEEPIEGAVVVAVYWEQTFGIPDWPTGVIDVKETLTDKDGRFTIPSYTMLINPFAWSLQVGFTIFKPGYGSVNDFPVEDVFTNKAPEYPEVPESGNMELKLKFRPGEALLPRVGSERDFGLNRAGLKSGAVRWKQVPLLRKLTMDNRKAPCIKGAR